MASEGLQERASQPIDIFRSFINRILSTRDGQKYFPRGIKFGDLTADDMDLALKLEAGTLTEKDVSEHERRQGRLGTTITQSEQDFLLYTKAQLQKPPK